MPKATSRTSPATRPRGNSASTDSSIALVPTADASLQAEDGIFVESPDLEASPILYEPLASAAPMMRGEALQQSGDTQSSPKGNKGFVSVLSHRLPEPTSYSGKNIIALDYDPSFFKERPNQSELLQFNGASTYIDCGNPPQLQGGGGSLTIEAWIKIAKRDAEHQQQFIVIHGGGSYKDKDGKEKSILTGLKTWSGFLEFGTWWDGKGNFGALMGRDPSSSAVKNENIGVWVHVAGVYNDSTKTYTLYRNGKAIVSAKEDVPPPAINANWFIGAVKNHNPNNTEMLHHFQGGIAEVRIWTVARTEDQIRRYMMDTAPPAAPGELGAYWPLARNATDPEKVVDTSGAECDALAEGPMNWKWMTSPVGQLSRLLRREEKTKAQAALANAKSSGFFDPLVFPRLPAVMTQAEREEAIAAIKSLTSETFYSFYEQGYHLVLRRGFAGKTEYTFLQNPPRSAQPQLALVEEYRLSSFLGSYGVGRTVKSFSLLPGERTKLTIKTASSSSTTVTDTSSILDSYSEESASDFEDSLSQEQFNRSTSSSEFGWNASMSAGASWGWGHVNASAGAHGSSNSAREDFGKSVSNATSKHAAKASANRNVEVKSSSEKKSTRDEQNEIVRDIENINVGRTLNFVFCQMNQEFISLLHLVDFRIGYTNGIDPLREFPLHELPELLERLTNEGTEKDPKAREKAHAWIEGEAQRIRDYRGEVAKDFLREVNESKDSKVKRYAINRDFSSVHTDPATRTKIQVPGIIITANSIVMRTEDVAVDSLVGQGTALDSYARRLQQEENRRRRLANDKAEMENKLLESEVKRNQALLDLIARKDVELLKASAPLLRALPGGSPKRMVGIWEADTGESGKNGSAQARPAK